MKTTSAIAGNLPPVATSIQRGMRVIVNGRFGVIDECTSTELLVKFMTTNFSVSRTQEPRQDSEWVSWAEFIEPAGSHMLLDAEARNAWRSFKPHNQRKLMARLAVVCLVHTGTRSGSSHFVEDGEPIAELAPDRAIRVTPRTKLLADLLREAPHPWMAALVAALNATSGDDETVHDPPSGRTIGRWVTELHSGAGVFGLVDDRGGDRTDCLESGGRRGDTELLVDEVIAGRDFRVRSNVSNRWVMDQVSTLAADREIPILGRTQLAALVTSKMSAAGRKPSEVKTAKHHGDRTDHQNPRSIYVGHGISLDATFGDNLVRLTPDGPPLRPYVHVCIENSTGVVVSVDATGLYKDVNVGVLMYDAFTPALIVPDPSEMVRTRMKGIPKEVRTSGLVFKPGAIPGRVRSDNAAQNHSRYILGIAEALGADVAPSRPGVSSDNSLAEASISALRVFFESQPGYVGRNTTERAEDVAKSDDLMLIDEYRARLQHWAYMVFNHAPTTAPLFARSRISRLKQWDEMIALAGAPPMLLDRNALFAFLPRREVTRTPKGIQVGAHYYSSPELHRLPKHLIDMDRRLTVVHDPRRLDCIWIEDPVENIVIEVPNRLRDVMQAPLTQMITTAALQRGSLRGLGDFHAARAFAHHASLVMQFGRTARIERELADWRGSVAGYLTAIRNGAVVFGPAGVVDVPSAPIDPRTTRPGHESANARHDADNGAAAQTNPPPPSDPSQSDDLAGRPLDDPLDRPLPPPTRKAP